MQEEAADGEDGENSDSEGRGQYQAKAFDPGSFDDHVPKHRGSPVDKDSILDQTDNEACGGMGEATPKKATELAPKEEDGQLLESAGSGAQGEDAEMRDAAGEGEPARALPRVEDVDDAQMTDEQA